MPRLLAAFLLLAASPAAPGEFRSSFFFDEDRKKFAIADLEVLSDRRVVAAGALVNDEKESLRGLVVATADGGGSWSRVEISEPAVALFFLNDSQGWLATTRGIWVTQESGRAWKKISSLSGVRDLWFLDAVRGFAAGFPKSVWETRDGGRTWKPVPAAKKPESREEFTSYDRIQFVTPKRGLIVGGFSPPRRDLAPAWADPERARRERPTLTVMLETADGGETWEASTAPLFGRVTQSRFAPDGTRLLVLRFDEAFDWPSEVFRGLPGGRQERAFREKNQLVTDVLPVSKDYALLAAVTLPGRLNSVPVPGKVRILESRDLAVWEPLRVDYRAVARRVILSGSASRGFWAATDQGMILRLAPQE
jgi:hypothetical protein